MFRVDQNFKLPPKPRYELTEKDRHSLATIIEHEENPELSPGVCATSPGWVSHYRKLERHGFVECTGYSLLHSDFKEPYGNGQDSEYLVFNITKKGREAVAIGTLETKPTN